jgi:hypothetical protein
MMRLLAIAFIFATTVSSVRKAPQNTTPPRDAEVVAELRSMIAKLRIEEDPDRRAERAQLLTKMVQDHHDVSFGSGVVADLAEVLRDESDRVRYWVALALSHMGPQARDALPALERALQERPETRGKTSATAIRIAIDKIRGPSKSDPGPAKPDR